MIKIGIIVGSTRPGRKALDVARIARFFVDVSDGDRKKATCLARRLSRESGDRIFARAVSVAVERYLARIEVK